MMKEMQSMQNQINSVLLSKEIDQNADQIQNLEQIVHLRTITPVINTIN